jgi:hypothetical protein
MGQRACLSTAAGDPRASSRTSSPHRTRPAPDHPGRRKAVAASMRRHGSARASHAAPFKAISGNQHHDRTCPDDLEEPEVRLDSHRHVDRSLHILSAESNAAKRRETRPRIDDLQSSSSTAPTAGRVALHATLSEPAPNALRLVVEAASSRLTRRDGASHDGRRSNANICPARAFLRSSQGRGRRKSSIRGGVEACRGD